jgi:hypothetical protein
MLSKNFERLRGLAAEELLLASPLTQVSEIPTNSGGDIFQA